MDRNNPYESPEGTESPPPPVRDRRWLLVCLPPAIPPIAHPVVDFLISDGFLADTVFLVSMIAFAIGWTTHAVNRLRLPFFRAYFLSVVVVAATLLCTIMMFWFEHR